MGLGQWWRAILFGLCGGYMALAILGCRDAKPSGQGQDADNTTIKHYGGIYRKSFRQEPVTLDPVFITDVFAASVAHQLFDGLVQFDADLNVAPGIARAWKSSHNGLIWTFYLRQGVYFHHGREVNADDFVYTFTRLLHRDTASPRTWLLEYIQGAKEFRLGQATHVEGLRALDPFTLQITLAQPYAPFINVLGMVQVKVLPREEVERLGAEFGRRPVGTGPFRFQSWTAGESILLEANPAYHEGRPFLDALHYRIIPSDQNILAEFAQGTLDNVELTGGEGTPLVHDTRFRFMRKPLLATVFLWLDTRQEVLSNPKVRQAINYAINREVISTRIRQNRHVQARGILPRGMPGYNPDLVAYTYDPPRAQALLAEAGYPAGQGLPPLELWSSAKNTAVIQEHEAIRSDLAQVGIQLELRYAENWQHFTTAILGKRPGAMYRYSWFADFPDPDNFLYSLFHSQSPNNFAHYQNPEVDRLLEQVRMEGDYLIRMQRYRHIEALIMADAPVVNLVYHTFEHLFQPYVQGIELNGLGERYIPMKKIWLNATQRASLPSRQR